MTGTCSFAGCEAATLRGGAKGLCGAHYRQQKLGQPLRPVHHPDCHRWILDHQNYDGDECLLWPFTRANGRGTFRVGGVSRSATRYMCELKNGPPPTPKHHAAHSCGRGHLGCIHPGHLRWATPAENNADKVAHGTAQRGERHNQAILSESDVIAIRILDDMQPRAVTAAEFGISYHTVWDIAKRRSWSHI